jgi:hypothetical protein
MAIPDRHVTRIDGHVTLQLLTLVNYKYSRTFKVFTHGLDLLFCVFPAKQHMQCEEYLHELYRLLVSPPLAVRLTPHLSALVEIFDSPFRDREVLPRNDNYAMSKLSHCYRDRERRFQGVKFAGRIDRSRLRSRYLKDPPILEDSSRESRAQTRRRR